MERREVAVATEHGDEAAFAWRRRPARETTSFRSPRVRALAARLNVDVDSLVGTGLGGRVTARDVLASTAGPQRLAFNRVRARAAKALRASKRTSAHAWTAMECDYSAIEVVRQHRREAWRAEFGFSLTYLPFVARALIDALSSFPHLNATLGDGDTMTLHRDVGLGIAVDLDYEGLVVPVIRKAESLRIVGIARAVADLAERARSRRLVPDDLAGGTFTITNPGAHGTYLSVPILNQPQVAILSTDGVAKRVSAALGLGGQSLAVRPTGHLCLSYDRRAVDEGYAGGFLALVKEIVEGRDWKIEV